jgi:hypothetical protein
MRLPGLVGVANNRLLTMRALLCLHERTISARPGWARRDCIREPKA